MTISVLVADDHPVVREGLLAMLGTQREISVVAEAADGRQAVELTRLHRPDIVLMDLDMPNVDGVQAIREIRETDPDAKVIVLTAYDTDDRILDAIQAGARGYLLKGVPRDELSHAIRIVNDGGSLLQPDVASKLLTQVGRLLDGEGDEQLTPRELEVLREMGRGLRNKEIARALGISERTVKFHIGIIFQKLGVGSRTEALAEGHRRRLIKL
ncbi:MAG: DNA-binding response regulator [Dehalococcoidia bacterium]|nr:MAG: DNA-binding response regulator [Dehalococcoidia bacterium]